MVCGGLVNGWVVCAGGDGGRERVWAVCVLSGLVCDGCDLGGVVCGMWCGCGVCGRFVLCGWGVL